ncbi:MAG: hypothetical protein J6B21_04690 [Oscillospiraceae bacterium]|nr:hypothetical protein [Oscillospiraceae bacterium]
MISMRSRALSWILTLTLVFTTLFGNSAMAFADTAAVPQDTAAVTETQPDGEAVDHTGHDHAQAEPSQTVEPQQTEPAPAETVVEEEVVTYNVDLLYTEDTDENGDKIFKAPENGKIVFEYKDADGKTVTVDAKDLAAAASDDDIDDGMELTAGTKVTVKFTPDKNYETFYYMAYLAKDEDQEVKMELDDEDDIDFTKERTATFTVGEDDIIVDILFTEVEATTTPAGTAKEEAVAYAKADGWYWSGSTLYIKDGQAIDLYDALTDNTGLALNPKAKTSGLGKYSAELRYAASTASTSTDSGWEAYGTKVIDNESVQGLTHNGVYKAAATTSNSYSFTGLGKWNNVKTFNVVHYYTPTITVTMPENMEAADEQVTVNGTKYVSFTTEGSAVKCAEDETNAEFIITAIEGFDVEIRVGDNDPIKATASGDVLTANIRIASSTTPITVAYVPAEKNLKSLFL